MTFRRRATSWNMVIEALKSRNDLGLYLSYDDDDRRVLRCNNGWIQAKSPKTALAFVLSCQ